MVVSEDVSPVQGAGIRIGGFTVRLKISTYTIGVMPYQFSELFDTPPRNVGLISYG